MRKLVKISLFSFVLIVVFVNPLQFASGNQCCQCCCLTQEKAKQKKSKNKKEKKKEKEKDKDKDEKEKSPTPVWPVVGNYMTKDAKTLGPFQTGCCLWINNIHYRGWLDGYIIHNFNYPYPSVVNAFNYLSVIKGRNISIENRVFDVHSNEPTLLEAEIEIEKFPERCQLGFKLDLAVGDTQDIMADTIAGSFGFDSAAAKNVKDTRYIQHVSLSYMAPIGKGLRFDFGKFITHLGAEYVETVKNWNYSHSIYNTYGVPAQETGLRIDYQWSDKFYTDFYILNGWNCAFVDNNSAKSWGPTIGWTISKELAIVFNYLQGPEQNNNNKNDRRIWDAAVTLGPFIDRWTFIFAYGHGSDENAVEDNTKDATWEGVSGYIRYKINDEYEPVFRIEYYDDPDGFTTNVPQHSTSYTLTYNIKFPAGPCKRTLVLIRPEVRYDHSSDTFFSAKDRFRIVQHQWTYGVGLSWIM